MRQVPCETPVHTPVVEGQCLALNPPSKLATLAGALLLAAMVPYFFFTVAWMRLWGLPKETK
jgi:hypothetical protein